MKTILYLALGLALVQAVPAAAQTVTRTDGVQETVSLKGLDLNSPDGARAALARLQAAARRVCGPEPSFRDLERSQAFKACVDQTLNQAVAGLGNDEVDALHGGAPQRASAETVPPRS